MDGRLGRFGAALLAATLGLGTAVGGSAPAGALLSSAIGNVIQIAPPASVQNGLLQHPTSVFVFNEQQGVTLASQMLADFKDPGTYDDPLDLSPFAIPAGTVVDSHMMHSDVPNGGNHLRTFTLTFPTDIVGVIVGRVKLNQSDVLGAPATTYPARSNSSSGLEFGPGAGASADVLVLPDRRTIQATILTAGGLDQMRVLTAHNSVPTANAGGPYAATEGSPTTLAGSASDPDGDPLTTSWGLTWTGTPGTSCSATGSNTLTPAVTCDDDALVTATLSVSDGLNTPVTSVANVTVGNVAPSVGALTTPAVPLPVGTAAGVNANFTDAGTNDSHTAIVSWGDTTSTVAAVSGGAGSGNASGSHVYALPGLYTVTLTLTDDDLGATATTGYIEINGPPAADTGGPYSGSEGLPTTLVGTATDPENDPLTTGWIFSPGAIDAGGTCAAVGTTTLVPSLVCTDDAVVAADLSASDGINPPSLSSTTVTVNNEAPVLGALAGTAGPIATGAPVGVVAPFTDAGVNDTHTATVDWGDLSSSPATVTETAGAGAVSAGHFYTTPGIYTIIVTLTDDDLGFDSKTTQVIVNSSPTVDAGGPYVGLEGAVLSLTGTAADPDGDGLAVLWGFSVTGDPGVVCTPAGAGTLTPTLVCTDDATVTATLTVSDGVNPAVSDTTTIAVGNAVPVTTPAVASASPAPVGSTVSVGLTFSDAGIIDTHTATIDWGDAASTAGTVVESAGAGTVSGAHVYATSGIYTISATVIDDNGGSTTETATVIVNGSPTAGAGGPYNGVEGAPVTLNGTAADPDADVLLIAWTSSIVSADVGTTCSLSGAATLTPLLTCDDNAVVDVTLTVADGVNPTVVDTVPVTIANAAPAVAAPAVTSNPTVIGSPVTLSASFTDPGVNDDHTATINWGVGPTVAGSVSEIPGSGTVSGGHIYSASGTYTVTVTVNDKDNGTSSVTTTVVVNGAPTVSAGGPYTGVEGTPVTLAGSAVDPEGDPLSISWSFAVSSDVGGGCIVTGSATLTPTITCNDDATVVATLTVSDGVNAPVVKTTTVTVANVAPAINSLTVPVSPVPIGTAISAATTFTDAGTNDVHVASIVWGDATTSPGAVTETAGSGSALGTHAYAGAGTYTVKVTITDDNTGSVTATASSYVVVYDPSAGFVTGGGWITSPSGAYTPTNSSDPDHVGKANFGFVSKYLQNSTVPTGSTEFQLKTGDLNFHSTGNSWLVVEGDLSKAYYRGQGRVNNVSGYEFLVSVIDGSKTGGGDRFRIKVWNNASGTVLFDNLPGAPDNASAVQPNSGGSIVIH